MNEIKNIGAKIPVNYYASNNFEFKIDSYGFRGSYSHKFGVSVVCMENISDDVVEQTFQKHNIKFSRINPYYWIIPVVYFDLNKESNLEEYTKELTKGILQPFEEIKQLPQITPEIVWQKYRDLLKSLPINNPQRNKIVDIAGDFASKYQKINVGDFQSKISDSFTKEDLISFYTKMVNIEQSLDEIRQVQNKINAKYLRDHATIMFSLSGIKCQGFEAENGSIYFGTRYEGFPTMSEIAEGAERIKKELNKLNIKYTFKPIDNFNVSKVYFNISDQIDEIKQLSNVTPEETYKLYKYILQNINGPNGKYYTGFKQWWNRQIHDGSFASNRTYSPRESSLNTLKTFRQDILAQIFSWNY
jgi:hypothetical protein